MLILNSKTKISDYKTCVALGNFDGVHLGHRKIIEFAIQHSQNKEHKSCVYTFKAHSSSFLGSSKPLITNNTEKETLIASLGCDILFYDNFEEIRHMSPSEFCSEIIYKKLNCSAVFCGENYRFGYSGQGNTEILKNELKAYGIDTVVVPYAYYKSGIISSTEIRNRITDGNITEANAMLGHSYTICGKVMHGKHLGRTLGFPTLNIPLSKHKAVPAFGVYVSECLLENKAYKAISNIGIRPTTDSLFNDVAVNCETYLFDYTGDAYEKNITVSLLDFIRPEIKFNSVDELKKQIQADTLSAKLFFNNYRS